MKVTDVALVIPRKDVLALNIKNKLVKDIKSEEKGDGANW